MLALISPAKKLDFETSLKNEPSTQPDFLRHSQEIVEIMKGFKPSDLQKLMKVSDKLGILNYSRYQQYATPFTPDNARQAIRAFRGDTYVGLDADTLSSKDLSYAQDHLRTLSGLYGLLRPLDLMQAYRLEMGTKLPNARGEDLYNFWGSILTNACNDIVRTHKNKSVISLASNEYIKAINPKELSGDFITCHFKELKKGQPKVVGLFAKRARGMMARFMMQNRIETPKGLKEFNEDGYAFVQSLSDETNYVFLRDNA